MKTLKVLIKINALSMLRAGSKKALNRSTAMLMLAYFALALVFGFQMYSFSSMMAPFLKITGSLETLLTLAVFFPAIINLSMGMYKIPGYLFGFKDYDILMSLPVKERTVLTAKLFPLYMSDMLYGIVLSAPIFYVYGMYAEVSALFYVMCVLAWFFMPMLPLTVGALISLGIAKLTHKTKGNLIQNIANMVMMIVLAGSFIFINPVYSGGNTTVMNDISGYYPPAMWFSAGTSEPIYYLLFIAVSLLPFLVFVVLFARSFKRINSVNRNATTTSKYKVTHLKKSGARKMLMTIERKRFFANSIIVLNSGFGLVMYLAGFIFMIVGGKSVLGSLFPADVLPDMLFYMFCALGLFICATTLTTPFSISIEGKNFWHLRVLPVKAQDVFKAKVGFNLLLTLPFTVFFNVVLAVVLGTNLVAALCGTVAVLSLSFFFPLLGMTLNVRFVNFDWRSADEVVKRGASMTICVVSGIVGIFGLGFLFVVLYGTVSFDVLSLITAGAFLIPSVIMWARLMRSGERLLSKI